ELHHRRVPPSYRALPQLVEVRDVRYVFPGTGCGTHRSRVCVSSTNDTLTEAFMAAGVRWIAAHCTGFFKETAGRRPAGEIRRFGLRAPGNLFDRDDLVGRDRLFAADLLRFFRLFGHRHRRVAHHRLRLAGKLQHAVLVGVDYGVLAALAHHTVAVAARLPVHSAGRQPQRQIPDVHKSDDNDVARWIVARGQLD